MVASRWLLCNNRSPALHSVSSPAGPHESDFDADAEAGGSSSADEAAASSEDDQPAAAGAHTAADAPNIDAEAPDSDIDGGLDELGHQSSSNDEDHSDIAADSDPDSDDPDDASNSKQQHHASFLEGGKSASFAKAFAKIMAKPSKAAATKAATPADVILSESASMAKRKAEVAADEAAARETKKQRLELKRRGHLKVPKKGADPAHDVREKQLQKLATRGVVLLFNAVNKAQKQKREAEAAGLKGAKALKAKPGFSSKAGFFAELKAGAQQAVAGLNPNSEQLVPGAPAGLGKGQSAQGQRQQQQQQQGRGGVRGPAAAADAAVADGAGWDVLSEGFPGLTGGVKMKDWDKTAVSDEELNGQALAGSDDGSDGDDGW
eukprot:GHUV01040803.1.p1 GENE.GHUV01040803.1~~GHUV01040803.1.p1  ORF type:complete len:378 (+),score=165.42 GHUV01040803.1:47-1180(+)